MNNWNASEFSKQLIGLGVNRKQATYIGNKLYLLEFQMKDVNDEISIYIQN